MRRITCNIPLGAGLLIQSAVIIVSHLVKMPDLLYLALSLVGLALIIWGGILAARSPEMTNSRLRQIKMQFVLKILHSAQH